MVLCSRCEREKVYTLFTVNNKNKKIVQRRKKMGFTMGNRKDIYNVGERYGIYNGNTVFYRGMVRER